MALEVVAEGFEFPEGPSWHSEGCVYLVNCNSEIIHRVWDDGRVEEFGRTFGKGNGSTFGLEGLLYVADYIYAGIVRFDASGNAESVINEHSGQPFRGRNDLVFDSKGILYFTDPRGTNEENPVGGVYRAELNGKVTQLGNDFAFPNGLALDLAERYLYVAESNRNRIRRISLYDQGAEWEIFAELPSGGVPDGVRFDAEGNLWIAHFGSGNIYALSPEGQLIASHKVGGMKPTNLDFGGIDGKTLYITDADTNTLRRMRVAVPGAKFRSQA